MRHWSSVLAVVLLLSLAVKATSQPNVFGNRDPRFGTFCTPGQTVFDLDQNAAFVCQESRATCVQRCLSLAAR